MKKVFVADTHYFAMNKKFEIMETRRGIVVAIAPKKP